MENIDIHVRLQRFNYNFLHFVLVVILRYTVTPLGGQTSLYLEDLGDNEHTRGGSRVRTINNPFELTES